jgi:hypothetical protein
MKAIWTYKVLKNCLKRRLGMWGFPLLVFAFSIFYPPVLSAKVFQIASRDVTGLIAAMKESNARGGENIIVLKPGVYTLTTSESGTVVGPGSTGPVGLPVITSTLTLRGESAQFTTIARDQTAPVFRILLVSAVGSLTVEGVTITGGVADQSSFFFSGGGAGIANEGRLTIKSSKISDNRTSSGSGGGGGLFNRGTMIINKSTIAGNAATLSQGGGILNLGNTAISESTISGNFVLDFSGGGIANRGTLIITNSTIANNFGGSSSGVGIENEGTLTIIGSTIAGNLAQPLPAPLVAGIRSLRGSVNLQNSVLAKNITNFPPAGFPETDCAGTINSLGNNLIGDPTGCAINLQATDLIGEPLLGEFVDSGAPGNGRFPILPGSRLIDAGYAEACTATDQLDTPRNGPCDIGAIEFYPILNASLVLRNSTQVFDPSPVLGGPAGTLRITAHFVNTGNQTVFHPFAEVLELSGGNLLLNADGGAGGKGARLTLPSSGAPFQSEASRTFQFLIGLQHPEMFTFLVNMLGAVSH